MDTFHVRKEFSVSISWRKSLFLLIPAPWPTSKKNMYCSIPDFVHSYVHIYKPIWSLGSSEPSSPDVEPTDDEEECSESADPTDVPWLNMIGSTWPIV